MMRPRILAVAAVLQTLAIGVAASPPPNVVLIVADDLGYGDLGCYGSTANRTPHIDKLAANGLRFTDFHSAGPMCTPTRVAMLTGWYQQRFGRKFDGALSGVKHRDTGLPLQAVTIAELLRDKGYATACFGKWHLGYQPPFLPTDQGFDEFRGLASGDGDHHTHIDRSGNADWWRNNELAPEEGYTSSLLSEHSVRFIREHRRQPFFLYVPHLAIHFPWQGPNDPPHRQAGKNYDQDKWGVIPDPANVAPHVKAMVEALDRSVCRVVGELSQLKLLDDTFVIVTSDNGGYLNYGSKYQNISSNGPLRGQKGTMYEGGHRVPMVMHWPGKISPGVTDGIANSIDLFSTIAAVAGIDTQDLRQDGVDLSPLLLKRTPLPERMLFWRKGQDRAVRSGPWKLCVAGGKAELYNLDNDLGEKIDLATERREQVRELRRSWIEWQNDVNLSR